LTVEARDVAAWMQQQAFFHPLRVMSAVGAWVMVNRSRGV
jgi:hypothetical protein